MRAGESLRALSASVRTGERGAVETVEAALARIAAGDGAVNAFTAVTRERALAEAAAIDATRAAGRDPGPLAGVPFAVKNLYDVAGIPTIAGSHIDRSRAPAVRDAALVRRLTAAGAVLVGALNMDEYAYGFSTENTHHGATRNPHDQTRITGGSSGGSAAAVAASLTPLTPRLRHQRIDPRSGGALRRVRLKADLWPAEPVGHAALLRQPRRRRAVRTLGGGSRGRL
jgi:Asp-tRNA(Asn)/Glu-tRNA(Gln) amidotransferase A subunit family amidase